MSNEEEEPVHTSKFIDIYSEKIWTRDDGQIDGYSFKGKRTFGKALEGLKSILVKGEQKEIQNVTYKALDTRIEGSGLVIDVEVRANMNRGVAVVKIYGPKEEIKKDNSVTVTKSKRYDSKFVIILAEKVIKPLMNGFLSGELEMPISENLVNGNLAAKQSKNFKCSFCEKICKTQAGLKGHITKMHLNMKQLIVEDAKNENEMVPSKKRKMEEEVTNVVESLICSVVNANVKDETIEESKEEILEEKRYTKMCNSCDFKVESNKSYISVQKILKHRDLCIQKEKCGDCDFRFKSQGHLKRHMRDKHSLLSISTSPPLKKKKVDEDKVIDLSESLEDMEIDEDEKEQKILLERSRKMDEKVLAKQKKHEEEIDMFLSKKSNDDKQDINKQKKSNSKKRQKSKKKTIESEQNKNQEHLVKNMKEVPDNCKHLVNEGDLVYVVPGDGACGANSAAAHLFQDELLGPKLRQKVNEFFVKHFDRKYKHKTPCTTETPFRRKVNKRTIEFKDPKDLTYWLMNSNEANYMWFDSEDLIVIADMYQIRIKVITTKGISDKEPTVNWIYPDEDLKEHAEINVKMNDMVLLHENDVHFNLVIAKDSNLANMGSISNMQNIAALNKIKTVDVEEIYIQNDVAAENKILKKELKEAIESKKALEKLYNDCEIALKEVSGQNEKLKIEIKDLKEICEFENGDKICDKVVDKQMEQKHEEKKFDCIKSKFKSKTEYSQKRQIEESHDEKEYNCSGCDFQATTQLQLNKHTNLKHRMKGQLTEEVIKCKHCGDQFSAIWNLMNHRKEKHENFVRPCKNYQDGKCIRTSETCWWRHENVKIVQNLTIKCFICNEIFETKSQMMQHRKREHRDKVRSCVNYLQNKCDFLSQSCWFLHDDDDDKEMEVENNEKEQVKESKEEKNIKESVFQEVTENLEPPISTQEEE